jgi:hypothetical protein
MARRRSSSKRSSRKSSTKHAMATKRMYAKAKKLSGKHAKPQTVLAIASKLAAGKKVTKRRSSRKSSPKRRRSSRKSSPKRRRSSRKSSPKRKRSHAKKH